MKYGKHDKNPERNEVFFIVSVLNITGMAFPKKFSFLIVCILASVTLTSASQGLDIEWNGTTLVRDGSSPLWVDGIALDAKGQDVAVAWVEGDFGSQTQKYKISYDYGASWGESLLITNTTLILNQPAIDMSSDSIYDVVLDTYDEEFKAVFKKGDKLESTWNEPIEIEMSEGAAQYASVYFDVESKGPGVFVVWQQEVDNYSSIHMKRSYDWGKSFGNAVELVENGEDITQPSISSDETNVYLSYIRGNKAYLMKSEDDGESWSDSKLFAYLSGYISKAVVSATGNGKVHLIWGDSINLSMKTSEDYGESWSEAQIICEEPPNWDAVVDSGYIHTIWQEVEDSRYKIYHRKGALPQGGEQNEEEPSSPPEDQPPEEEIPADEPPEDEEPGDEPGDEGQGEESTGDEPGDGIGDEPDNESSADEGQGEEPTSEKEPTDEEDTPLVTEPPYGAETKGDENTSLNMSSQSSAETKREEDGLDKSLTWVLLGFIVLVISFVVYRVLTRSTEEFPATAVSPQPALTAPEPQNGGAVETTTTTIPEPQTGVQMIPERQVPPPPPKQEQLKLEEKMRDVEVHNVDKPFSASNCASCGIDINRSRLLPVELLFKGEIKNATMCPHCLSKLREIETIVRGA